MSNDPPPPKSDLEKTLDDNTENNPPQNTDPSPETPETSETPETQKPPKTPPYKNHIPGSSSLYGRGNDYY